MANENDAADPYLAVLADLRAKRLQIDQSIALLEGMRAFAPLQPGGAFSPLGTSFDTPSEIIETAGMYLGMSIVDATKKLLAIRKKTLGNVEIARQIQAGGLVLTGADPANAVGSVLTRRFNQIGDVVKVGRGIWGLKEWYPGRTFKPAKMVLAEKQLEDLGMAPASDIAKETEEMSVRERELREPFSRVTLNG